MSLLKSRYTLPNTELLRRGTTDAGAAVTTSTTNKQLPKAAQAAQGWAGNRHGSCPQPGDKPAFSSKPPASCSPSTGTQLGIRLGAGPASPRQPSTLQSDTFPSDTYTRFPLSSSHNLFRYLQASVALPVPLPARALDGLCTMSHGQEWGLRAQKLPGREEPKWCTITQPCPRETLTGHLRSPDLGSTASLAAEDRDHTIQITLGKSRPHLTQALAIPKRGAVTLQDDSSVSHSPRRISGGQHVTWEGHNLTSASFRSGNYFTNCFTNHSFHPHP